MTDCPKAERPVAETNVTERPVTLIHEKECPVTESPLTERLMRECPVTAL